MNELPTTIRVALTITGMVVLSGLLTQWIKQYVPKGTEEAPNRFFGVVVNSICLALCLIIGGVLQAIQSAWCPTANEIANVLLLAFVAVSITTFGYETAQNWLAVFKAVAET